MFEWATPYARLSQRESRLTGTRLFSVTWGPECHRGGGPWFAFVPDLDERRPLEQRPRPVGHEPPVGSVRSSRPSAPRCGDPRARGCGHPGASPRSHRAARAARLGERLQHGIEREHGASAAERRLVIAHELQSGCDDHGADRRLLRGNIRKRLERGAARRLRARHQRGTGNVGARSARPLPPPKPIIAALPATAAPRAGRSCVDRLVVASSARRHKNLSPNRGRVLPQDRSAVSSSRSRCSPARSQGRRQCTREVSPTPVRSVHAASPAAMA